MGRVRLPVDVKRSGVRTRTLGVGWEERFLEAVRKAREERLIAPEAAEKLRLLAGAYFCATCEKEHRTESRLGRAHVRRQPKPGPEQPPADAAPLAVQLVASAKNAERARVGLVPKGGRAQDQPAAADQAAPPKRPPRRGSGRKRAGKG
jgi:hypothetical protein